jgi:hypothetical protein
MGGMRQVCVAGCGVFKEHHKTVSEAIAEPLGARIHAPRETKDAGNLRRKRLHDSPDIGDVLGGAGVFELKKGDVFDAFHIGNRGDLRTPGSQSESTGSTPVADVYPHRPPIARFVHRSLKTTA